VYNSNKNNIMEINLENYQPSKEQLKRLRSLLDISSECQKQGITVWVFGGYGLDALYGKLTRDHRDFDLYVKEGSEEKLVEIIKKLGYYLTPEKIGTVEKIVYRNKNLSSDFRLEYGTLEKIKKLTSAENLELLVPEKPLGKLQGQPIWTPTVEGFKRIIEINNRFAAKDKWEEYPYREWQIGIMKAIEKNLS